MITKLKNYFNNNITINEIPSNYHEYTWYTNKENDKIGIKTTELTSEQRSMLEVFLQPLHTEFINYSKEDKDWADYLFFGKEEAGKNLPSKPVAITQLFLSQPCIDKTEFETLLFTYFPTISKIIWKNHQYAVLLESPPFTKPDKSMFRSFVDNVQADFYLDAYFFIGIHNDTPKNLLQTFLFEEKAFQHVRTIQKKQPFYTIQESLPLLIANNLPASFMNTTKAICLQELQKDKELQKIFTTLFHNNLNVSNTAKELFLHRNSLLYRIDKFYEKTGFDVRLFHHALTIYISIHYIETKL